MKTTNLTKQSITKALVTYFLPVWAGAFFQLFYNTADAVIVGNFLGKDALAAVGGPAAIMVNLFVGFFVGLGSGATVLVSQFFGANDKENTNKSVHAAMALGIFSGVIMMILGIGFSLPVIKLMGTPEELIDMSMQYLNIYFAGIIFTVIYNLGGSILRAVGDSRRPLVFLVISSITNVILDIVFILVIPLGVAGAALATIISQALSAVLIVIALSKTNESYKLYIKKIRPHFNLLKTMMRIGIPSGLQVSVYTISGLIIQSVINSFGTDTIAAWSAFSKVDGIIWMTLNAVGITITTFVGQNFGAGNIDRVRKCVRLGMLFSLAIVVTLCFSMMLFAPNLLQIFVSDINVINIGVAMMIHMVPYYFLWVPIEIFGGTLRGAGSTLIPAIIQVFGVCGIRIVWMFVVVPLNPSVELVCLGYPVSWFLTSLTLFVFYKKGNWISEGLNRLQTAKQD